MATSGNLSDEPICTGNGEARERLHEIAERFLVHDRPIARHVDDSVVRTVAGAPQPLRRARGLAPLPVLLPASGPTVLAVGAHLKNTVTLALGERAFVSQHIGDMETPQAFDAFERVIADFLVRMTGDRAGSAVAHDLHPDYAFDPLGEGGDPAVSWQLDRATAESVCPWSPVQHHHAHLAACLAENGSTKGRPSGSSWDGTGYGLRTGRSGAASSWSGDTRRPSIASARLRPFRLPGERGGHSSEPRRCCPGSLLVGDSGARPLWERGEGLECLDRDLRRRESCRCLDADARATGLPARRPPPAPGRLFDGVASAGRAASGTG